MTESNDLNELHEQLDALGAHIHQARKHLDEKNLWNSGHHLTAEQLEARYKALKQQVSDEVKDAEDHGRHVSDFEISVKTWFEGFEIHK